ncbi:hypothetical protein [Burkholderia sp. 9120]|uniref:hypothetical protein n=1 Tax=Burkholderia sp. 9120 TaxID=1500897 RepID=UPI00054E8CE8|nr:hypothetical protein [Burkholderia sp. 9120]
MDESSVYTDAGRVPAAISKPQPGPLLALLLSDAATDIEVVTRELDLRDEMRERLRRALDRVACAQAVLETMRVESVGASDEKTALRVRMREAVDLLAREWPEDYPSGAMERLLLQLSPR